MTMKTDMTGAAVVLGRDQRGARLGARTKVTAIAPLTENLPGNRAIKPGDVLTARNGTTIEVLNTDAEGRLVLADGLERSPPSSQPDAIIDVATLTGAVRVALGSDVAARHGHRPRRSSRRIKRVRGASRASRSGSCPLVDSYDKHLDSRGRRREEHRQARPGGHDRRGAVPPPVHEGAALGAPRHRGDGRRRGRRRLPRRRAPPRSRCARSSAYLLSR